MKKSTIGLGLLAVVLLGGGGGAYYWQQAQQRAEIFSTAVPLVPDLSNWPAPMRQRVEAAERRLAQTPIEGLAELSRLYHANGFLAEAAQCYTGLEQLDSREARWFHLHALILAGYGDTEPALRRWLRAVKLAPDYVPARLRLGDVYLKRSDRAAAAGVYRAILADHPREPYAQLGLARCEFDAGHWDAARQLLEPLVAQSDYILGYDLIVTVYEQLGMPDQARAVRARVRESGAYRDPTDAWSDALADDCYDVYSLSLASGAAQRNSDYALAYRRLDQALALAPDQATLHFQLGNLHKNLKAYSKARQSFERCAQLKPDFSDAWILLSVLCETVGDRAAADRAMMEGLKHCPASAGLQMQNAQRLVRDGHLEESIPLFRESIRLRPNEAEAYLKLADVLRPLGRKNEEKEVIAGALRAEPGHPGALAIRAMNSIIEGDELGARQNIRFLQNQPRTLPKMLDALLALYKQQFGRAFE